MQNIVTFDACHNMRGLAKPNYFALRCKGASAPAKNSRAQPLRVRPACRPIALLKAGAALSGMGLAGSARTALNFHRFTPSWPLPGA
jgi:hypothetical protein